MKYMNNKFDHIYFLARFLIYTNIGKDEQFSKKKIIKRVLVGFQTAHNHQYRFRRRIIEKLYNLYVYTSQPPSKPDNSHINLVFFFF